MPKQISKKQEATIALVMALIFIAILLLSLLSCSTRAKSMKYDAGSRETLVSSSERLSQSNIVDSIRKYMAFYADSIVISYEPSHDPDNSPPPQDLSPLAAVLASHDSSHVSRPDKSGFSAYMQSSPSASLSPLPRLSPKAVTIYAPHITAGSEEKSVDRSSSTSSFDKSVVKEEEETLDQESAPALSPVMMIIIVAIMTVVSQIGIAIIFLVYKNKR